MVASLCPQCGRALDMHSRDVRFRLPEPVLATVEQERAEGVWMSDEDPGRAVMMQVPHLGAFVRCLLPVRLTEGFTITFGLWLAVSPADLQHAFKVWWAPTYSTLVLDGSIANDVPPWGMFGAPARARVLHAEETPYVVESSDVQVAQVLATEWPHDEVLPALPG